MRNLLSPFLFRSKSIFHLTNSVDTSASWITLRPELSRSSLIALAITLGVGMTPAAQAYTQVTAFTYDGKSYAAYTNSTQITWTEARNYAFSVGGDLVSLNTPAENTAVFAEIQYSIWPSLWTSVAGSQFVGPYIGLYQPNPVEVQTGWKWVDGTSLTSNDASWYPSQPDNGYGVENVAVYFNQVSQWADIYDCATTSVPCSANNQPANNYLSKSFIVEFNPVKVPGPAPVLGGMAAMGWARRLRRRNRQYTL
jgi:Lectin C-type domain